MYGGVVQNSLAASNLGISTYTKITIETYSHCKTMAFNFSIYQLLTKKKQFEPIRNPLFSLSKMNSARSSPTIHIFNLPASSKPSKPSKMRRSYHPVTVRVQAQTLAYCVLIPSILRLQLARLAT
jgi:hypothetical protein